MNLSWAKHILTYLHRMGVHEVVVCAGARNAPFVKALQSPPAFQVYRFFEERSAAFFALGRIEDSSRPVAVITTSGTAVVELFPAVVEAYYQCLPLIVVSADRPKSYRNSGAPQCIEQSEVFGSYVESRLDLECGENISLSHYSYQRPLHFNICFDEPLLSSEPVSLGEPSLPLVRPWVWGSENHSLSELTKAFRSPLVVVSQLAQRDQGWVLNFLNRWNRPVYLESFSGLKTQNLRAPQVHGDEKILRTHIKNKTFDGVLRIGGVPTTRLWRDLEEQKLPVISFSRRPFRGLSSLEAFVYPLERMQEVELSKAASFSSAGLFAQRRESLKALLEKYPQSEPGMFWRISESIPEGSQVYLGNSLPIREWDLVCSRTRSLRYFANRGANGIDGQTSSFLGWAKEMGNNFAVLGDLTTLYDLSALWSLRERPLHHMQLLVVNNKGGRIFSRMFKDADFENRHDVNFEGLAKLWNCNYQKLKNLETWDAEETPCIVELLPDSQQTQWFWREWEES